MVVQQIPRTQDISHSCQHQDDVFPGNYLCRIELAPDRLEACLSPAPTELHPPGTWEFAASSVYWDAHYQAALFFLSYHIAVSGDAAKAGQRPNTLPAIRQVRDVNYPRMAVARMLVVFFL